MELLTFCADNGLAINEPSMVGHAAGGKQTDMINYLIKTVGCPLDAHAAVKAASSGNIAILKLLRQHGCPWDKRVCETAASQGLLGVRLVAVKTRPIVCCFSSPFVLCI
eukprot:m.157124 g.157124  ORF g.157124 m.157124 type:complete len:109 (+) comp17574_c0_seq3:952-1278(+)